MNITTIHGDVDDSLLEKVERVLENGKLEVEYYQDGELVHRSVTVGLIGISAAVTFLESARPTERAKGD